MVKTNNTLKFYDRVLKLGHLHYGLWNDDDALTLEALRQAQERYADYLAGWIPDAVRSVLDIGCGTGGMALKLREKGLLVTGVSPDPYQEEEFKKRTGFPFILSRFQELRDWPDTDLVLMAESVQYIPMEAGFAKCSAILKPGGWILAADYFTRYKDGSRLTKSGHVEEAYRKAGLDAGFELLRQEDLTARVVKTLRLVHEWVDTFGLPAFDLLLESAKRVYPRLSWLALRLFKRRLAEARSQAVLVDPEAFLRAKIYKLYLWQRKG